jgi:hypothetical protein
LAFGFLLLNDPFERHRKWNVDCIDPATQQLFQVAFHELLSRDQVVANVLVA